MEEKNDYLALIESDIETFFDMFYDSVMPLLKPELRKFIFSMHRKHRSNNSIVSYSYDLVQFSDFVAKNGIFDWRKVTIDTIHDYFTTLRKTEKKTKVRVQESTEERKMACLRKFFDYLVLDSKIIETNPLKQDTAITDGTRHRKLPEALTHEEAKRFIDAILDREDKKGGRQAWMKERDVAMFTILLNTGLRITEFCSMTLSDAEEICETGKFTILGKGKKERDVFLKASSINRLKEYLKVRPEINTQNDRLWLAKSLDELDRNDVYQLVQTYAKQANIKFKTVSPHKLRHTFATWLLDNDVDLRTIQELLGHKDISTTQIYTKVQTSRKERAIDTLPDF